MLQNLLPNPLHPAVVHLPIALTLLVPIFAIGALVAIRRGAKVVRAWSIAAALHRVRSIILERERGSEWVALLPEARP